MRRNCQILFRMPHTTRRQRAVLSYVVVCLSCSLLAAISNSRQQSARQNYAAYAETVNHCLTCNLHQPQFNFIKVKTMYKMKYERSCHSFLLRVAQRANWQREIEHFVSEISILGPARLG